MVQLQKLILKFVKSLNLLNRFLLSLLLITFSLFFMGCKKDSQLKIENILQVTNQKVKNITIFVHGTHTEILTQIFKRVLFIPNKLIKISDLDEYSYVKWFVDKMILTDPIEFPEDSFYAIGWSGILSPEERLKGAQNLYDEINKIVLDLKAQEIEPIITIIGHSHGGNVALNLAKVNSQSLFKVNRLILLATPVQKETESYIENDIFEHVYSIYSNADMIQILDPQGLQNATSSFFSHRRLRCLQL